MKAARHCRAVLLASLWLAAGCPHDLTRLPRADQHVAPDLPRKDSAPPDLPWTPPDQVALDITPADQGCPFPCVGTLSGTAAPGFINGAANQARYTAPADVAVDPFGDVYLADPGNHAIRQIHNNVVTTLAGDGKPGATNGPGHKARFYVPSGVAVDSKGVVYVADTQNHCIRRISKGQVSTLAGTCTAHGYHDGAAGQAKFYEPMGLALDSKGDVYVADSRNSRVRRISGGVVSTFAGNRGGCNHLDGPALLAELCLPNSLAFKGDELYVAGWGKRVRLISKGQVTTFAGTGSTGFIEGHRSKALMREVRGLAVTAGGDLLLAEYGSHVVRRISGDMVDTLAGNQTAGFADGSGSAAKFNYPSGVAVDQQGTIYVADSANNRLRVIK